MKKRLTLEQTWKNCLKMWEWIVEEYEQQACPDFDDIEALKQRWCKENNWAKKLFCNCFFCQFAERDRPEYLNCRKCPARRIDPEFNCQAEEYEFELFPVAFLAKLKELDKKRRQKTKTKTRKSRRA